MGSRVTRTHSRFRVGLAGAMLAVGIGITPAVATSASGDPPAFGWQLLDSGTELDLFALDAVSSEVAWVVSDTDEVLRTVDGGATFTEVWPDSLPAYFRDLEAVSADVAFVLVGGGATVYRTTDGGLTWQGIDPPGDLYPQCVAMMNSRRGFAVHPGKSKFVVLLTNDGGQTWTQAPPEGMPERLVQEWPYNCSATARTLFFAANTNSPLTARVFRSVDGGMTWTAADGPESASFIGMDFRTNRLGIAGGGDPGEEIGRLARSTDGGVTWDRVPPADAPAGFVQDLAWWSDLRGDERTLVPEAQRTVFAVAYDGSYVSHDRGKTWAQFDQEGFGEVDCAAGTLACWASSTHGKIAKLLVGN